MIKSQQDPRQAIDGFVAEYLKPFLEHKGFKSRTRTWSRKRDGYNEIISIQADKWNSRDEHAQFLLTTAYTHRPFMKNSLKVPPQNSRHTGIAY